MFDRIIALLFVLGLLLSPSLAQERVWDQEAARKKVQATLDLEKAGRPWDDIPWITSIEKAEAVAKEQNKPVFVFVFLRKPVGPKDAPC